MNESRWFSGGLYLSPLPCDRADEARGLVRVGCPLMRRCSELLCDEAMSHASVEFHQRRAYYLGWFPMAEPRVVQTVDGVRWR